VLVGPGTVAPRSPAAPGMTYSIPKYRTILARESNVTYARRAATDTESAVAVARAILDVEPVECLLVIYLSGACGILGAEIVSRGGVAGTAVRPAEIFRGAVIAGASSVALAHNHPSGDATPSREDVAMTRAAIAAGTVLGIPVVDHVIVARDVGDGSRSTSLRSERADLGW
jgi:DNA repair protein RadC